MSRVADKIFYTSLFCHPFKDKATLSFSLGDTTDNQWKIKVNKDKVGIYLNTKNLNGLESEIELGRNIL